MLKNNLQAIENVWKRTAGDMEQQHPQKAARSPVFGTGVPITVGPGFVNVPDGDLPDIVTPCK